VGAKARVSFNKGAVMQIPQASLLKIKENLRQRREQMLKLLELERHWPADSDDEQLSKLQEFIQKKEAIILSLENMVQDSTLPRQGLTAWLERLPAAERADIAGSLEMLREISILTLDWHQKNVGRLSVKAEEVAKVLMGMQQEKVVVKALRETQIQSARVDVVG
jgi:hypothetical protein